VIVGLIGARGTVPTSKTATTSFLVDNWYLFECPSEIVQAFHKYQQNWAKLMDQISDIELKSLGRPTLGKIRYIILSHLHFDHWGGLTHIIHRILLLEKEKRENSPLKLIIPKNSTLPFQQRMNQMFNSVFSEYPLPDEEFLYRMLTIEVGAGVKNILRIMVISDGESISLDTGYSLIAKKNNHLSSGSLSFKLKRKKTKLKKEEALKMGIPFDRTLKRIEKSQTPIKVGNLNISRSDLFLDEVTVLSYSGDTSIDSNLFKFFDETHILIHETTYLTPEELFHLDLHTDFDSLIKEADNLSTLKFLIPIHFSIRHTDEEIADYINLLSNKFYKVINPLDVLIVLITRNNCTFYNRVK
jgi:ribonuclease BN (tRNA processing enzyme)